MKNLVILVKMQLKEQLNFKRLDIKNVNLFHIVFSTLLTVLKFALVTVLCIAFLKISSLTNLFSIVDKAPVPDTVISIVFSAMLLLSIVSCVVGLTKSMYYARDNAVLLTLPCVPLQVYLSKLIIFFIFEVKRNLSFIVPLFLAYYISYGYGELAYPWMFFCILWISLFTVAIGALLSIPAMWIANFFKQRKYLQIAGLALTVSAIIIGIFYGISLIPENMDIRATWDTTFWQIQDFLKAYKENLSPLYHLTQIFLGESKNFVISFPIARVALYFAVLAATTIVLLILGLLIVKPLFYKMASTPFEYLKKETKPKPNKLRARRYTSVYTEFLVATKSTNRMFSNFGILVSVPMLIFFLNKIFLAMNTREMGDNMIVAFNVLIVMLILLNANTYASSIFSREGRSSYLIKTQPSKYPILILCKLLPNSVFVFFSFVATFIIMYFTTSLETYNLFMLLCAIGFVYLAHLFYCAELDLMNPQIELYATVGSSESNPNEVKATASAFIISFVSALAIFLLLTEGELFSVYIKFLIVGFIAFVYRVWLFAAKLRLYYKEK